MRNGAWLFVLLVSCAKTEERVEWKSVEQGLLTGIEDKKSGWRHFADAAAYDEFRKTHSGVEGRGKRDAHSVPLPDFDFSKAELVIVWVGTMYRTLEIVSVKPGIVEARETMPSFNEDEAQRMVNVGNCERISLPRTGKPVEVRWVK